MQHPCPIANAASQTLTISVSASYSSPSASPQSFFPSWCLFFIWSDDLTNTVSWRLLLSHQSSDSTYKDFNIFFIVLHSMIHSLQRYLCVFLFLFRRFLPLAVALPLLCRGKGGSKTFLQLLESIKRATLFFFASLESQQCFQWQLSCPFTPYS